MNSPRPPERSAPPKPPSPADDAVFRRNNRRAIGLGAAVIVFVTAGVYANSWAVPFVFDDHAAISSNASIRHLADLAAVLSPPGEGLTVDGRPILNLSLAVNYAISGTDPWSYHALNITLHTLAALVLFGIVRRSLVRTAATAAGGGMAEGHSASRAATALGFAVALLWSIHPLQTESVTYVIQRAESLMGLFYFLTLYGFIRATEPTEPRPSAGWYGLSWLACLAGMGTKEVMVSAPLIVWAYDALIVSGGWRSALARRRRYYLALLLTTGSLLGLALRTGSRGGTSGFGLDVTPWMYWPTQFQAVVHYLRLAAWPSPLVFDYGVQWTTGAAEVLPYAVPVAALVGFTGVAVWRQRAVGFLGLFFFAILAPTSIVPGNRQTISEHRMYLPLAAVIVLLVVLIVSLLPVARRRQLIAWGWLPLAGARAAARGPDGASQRDLPERARALSGARSPAGPATLRRASTSGTCCATRSDTRRQSRTTRRRCASARIIPRRTTISRSRSRTRATLRWPWRTTRRHSALSRRTIRRRTTTSPSPWPGADAMPRR
jgi:hypothetical protein